LVAARNIPKGTIISKEDLTAKRPGNGLAPVFKDRFVGLQALMDITEDEQISMDHAK
jgi:Sialic acid synthase